MLTNVAIYCKDRQGSSKQALPVCRAGTPPRITQDYYTSTFAPPGPNATPLTSSNSFVNIVEGAASFCQPQPYETRCGALIIVMLLSRLATILLPLINTQLPSSKRSTEEGTWKSGVIWCTSIMPCRYSELTSRHHCLPSHITVARP